MQIDYLIDEKNWPEVKRLLAERNPEALAALGGYLGSSAFIEVNEVTRKCRWIYCELEEMVFVDGQGNIISTRYAEDYNSDVREVVNEVVDISINNIDNKDSFRHFRNYFFDVLPEYAKKLVSRKRNEYYYKIGGLDSDDLDDKHGNLGPRPDERGDPIVEKKVEKLSVKSQQIMAYRAQQNLSHREIAKRLGSTEGSVRTRHCQNAKKVRELAGLEKTKLRKVEGKKGDKKNKRQQQLIA